MHGLCFAHMPRLRAIAQLECLCAVRTPSHACVRQCLWDLDQCAPMLDKSGIDVVEAAANDHLICINRDTVVLLVVISQNAKVHSRVTLGLWNCCY